MSYMALAEGSTWTCRYNYTHAEATFADCQAHIYTAMCTQKHTTTHTHRHRNSQQCLHDTEQLTHVHGHRLTVTHLLGGPLSPGIYISPHGDTWDLLHLSHTLSL